jgi:hypothetical protein
VDRCGAGPSPVSGSNGRFSVSLPKPSRLAPDRWRRVCISSVRRWTHGSSVRRWTHGRVLAGGQPPGSVAPYQDVERHLRERAGGSGAGRQWPASGVERDTPDVGDRDVGSWSRSASCSSQPACSSPTRWATASMASCVAASSDPGVGRAGSGSSDSAARSRVCRPGWSGSMFQLTRRRGWIRMMCRLRPVGGGSTVTCSRRLEAPSASAPRLIGAR